MPTKCEVFTSDLVKIWALSPKTCLGGSRAQQAPNTNIVTRPQVTLLLWRSSCRDLPTLLGLLQGQQHIERLLAVSLVYIVQRPRCRNYSLVPIPAPVPVHVL